MSEAERPGSRCRKPSRWELAGYGLLCLLIDTGLCAAFLKLWKRLRWPPRLGVTAYFAGRTALDVALRIWVKTRLLPWANRKAEEQARLRTELAARLGREPTNDELFDYWFERQRSEADKDTDAGAHPR